MDIQVPVKISRSNDKKFICNVIVSTLKAETDDSVVQPRVSRSVLEIRASTKTYQVNQEYYASRDN